MNEILLNVLVICITVLIVVLIFRFTKHVKSQRQEHIRRMAEERRWVFESFKEALAWGLRLKSARWSFEALSRSNVQLSDTGSSAVAHSTRWWTEQVCLADGMVAVGVRPPGADRLGAMGEMLMKNVLTLMLGEQAAGVEEVEVGKPALIERYLILAKDARQAQRLLNPKAEHLLLNWSRKFDPLIKLTAAGLQVEVVDEHLENPADILALIELGEALCQSW